MNKKMSAALAAVALATAAVSYLPTTAAYVENVGGENTVYRNLLSDTVNHFGLSNTSVSADTTYVYGAWNCWYCVCVWDGMNSYRAEIDTSQEIPVTDYFSSTTYACSFNTEFIGHPYMARFFYESGQYYHLQSVWTTSSGNFNAIQDQSRAHFLRVDESGDTIGEQVRYIINVEFPEEIEPSETTSPSFSLPENWIGTVEKTEPTYNAYTETIPSMTVPTLSDDIVSKTMIIPKILFDVTRDTWFFPIFIFCIIVTLLTYFIWLK